LNHCICLENTTNLEKKNQVIECYENEKEVLLAWTQLIQKEDPDIIIGYNIFGFDYPFMFDRADEHDCIEEFLAFSRYDDGEVKEELEETSIILASGAYDLKYPPMEGRLQIDVFTYMRKEFILPSYKLDYVSSYLISDKVKSFCNYVEEDDETAESCKIETKNMKGITLNCYVHFEIINHSNDLYENGKKFKVIELEDDGFIIEGHLSDELENETMQWGLAKDDVTPQDIFRMTNEGPNEKGIIAKYCIQDCNLVHQIFQKIDIMTTYIEMSKICSVPISFLMMRGQGIKLTSYIAKKCREMNTLMPLISKGNQWDMYEGAIVLEPKTNLYLDNPVACVDYSSLYPSSIISENISHDSKVWTKTYNLDHELLYQTGERDKSGTFIYDHLPGYKYVDIQYDTFAFKRSSASAAAKKVLTGYKVCRYAQFPNGERAIMPAILQELLAARTATKKQMKKENDPFMKNILDKRQLSIKVTANSLYGQTGAKTSTFYEMDVAASTTATGRKLLHYARDIIENVYNNLKVDTHHGIMMTNAEYIYGDTDSVFFTFNLKDEQGKEVRGQKALEVTIELAKEAGELATTFLKDPHDLEYEKTFMPFCLLSKKRYVGMLYEEDPHKCKRKSMGIVLKRRDNAPIVKDVYGGIIDILMKQQNIQQSISFLDQMLNDIVNQTIPIHKLIISKSLRSFYKNPKQIAHKVLADRMGQRDPGNKPGPGDRIPYVYILTSKKKDLQGNKIENPHYIKEKKLKIDYGFYITNQIMKPVLQIYSLVLNDMPQFSKRKKMFQRMVNRLQEDAEDYDKFHKKVQQLKDKEVEKILFEKYLIINKNKANNNTMITSFFQ
jgi:DNA polymerase elongation subunit (family B)